MRIIPMKITILTNPAQRLHQLLSGTGLSLAVAESLTAGNLQAAIASVSGASNYFAGGVTVYNLDQKVNLLGIDRIMAENCNCVSEKVALQMALGVRDLFNSGIGVATTGYAEPSLTYGVSVPFAWFAIVLADGQYEIGRLESIQSTRIAVQNDMTERVLERLLAILGE